MTAPMRTAPAAENRPVLRKQNVAAVFDQVARAWPDRMAVENNGVSWSYADLRARSELLARGLTAMGIKAGTAVGVLGSRSAEACATMLGLLRIGAAYVPLDAALPTARLREMAATAGVSTAIRLPGEDGTLPDEISTVAYGDLLGARNGGKEPSLPSVVGDAIAYVMFTSGSTGRPKAVGVTHRGVVRLALDNGFTDLGPGRRMMHASTLLFDASTLEIWPTLLSGACLVVTASDLLLAPQALREHIDERGIDSIFLTTGIFHHVARTCPEAFSGLHQVMTGGEVLHADAVDSVLRLGRPRRLINLYGPTENTVVATAHLVEAADGLGGPVPIGRPLPYVRCVIMKPDGGLAEAGQVGELFLGGDGQAAGYVGDPGETARRFLTLQQGQEPAERFYRTGDQARVLPDGTIEFCGRLDQQVKVRGFRIELAEVETTLAAHPMLSQAQVTAVEDGTSRRLVAFHTLTRDAASVPTRGELHAFLAERLPAYMVPAEFRHLAGWPLTSSGKIDRCALAAMAAPVSSESVSQDEQGDEPVSDAVRRAWRATLGSHTGSGPASDFFADGGDSLAAARLIARVQAYLGHDGSHGYTLIKALLTAPTLGAFTHALCSLPTTVSAADPAPHSTVDRWRSDIWLHEPPPARRTAGHHWRNPQHVLLTGATGFFGSYLLRELLARTHATVHCVVRAASEADALTRIANAQRRYGHPADLPTERIVAHPGDLTAPRIGLETETWNDLASHTDVIYHAGAHVNFVYPYEWLRPANVDGTRELIHLAFAGGRIPLHYVSSIAVLAGEGSADIRHVTEDTPLEHVERLSMGYPESKWVAEELLRQAHGKGLPIAIHRPYEITGNTTDGTWNTEAAMCAFIKAIADMGTAPDIELPLDYVPADYLARAIVHLTHHVPAHGQTYHLTNPGYALLPALVDRLRAAGHPVATLTYPQWTAELLAFCARNPTHPIVSFIPIFTQPATHQDYTVKELYLERTFPTFTRTHADTDLAGTGITCPPVTTSLLDSYLRYFHTTGYLIAPHRPTPHQPALPASADVPYRV